MESLTWPHIKLFVRQQQHYFCERLMTSRVLDHSYQFVAKLVAALQSFQDFVFFLCGLFLDSALLSIARCFTMNSSFWTTITMKWCITKVPQICPATIITRMCVCACAPSMQNLPRPRYNVNVRLTLRWRILSNLCSRDTPLPHSFWCTLFHKCHSHVTFPQQRPLWLDHFA